MSDATETDEQSAESPGEPALLSEDALAEDWDRSEEDAGWAYLQIKE